MAKKKTPSEKGDALRRQAERLLAKKGKSVPKKLPQDAQKLIHELQVHQVELEMQNEELRRAQLELEESRNKYAELYEFAPVGYFNLDQKGRIVEVNLTGAWLLGVERSSLINKPFFRFVMPESRNQFHSCQQKIFTKPTKETCELELRKKDGSSFYASMPCISVQDSKGKFTQCRCAIIDLTEHKLMERIADLASFPELDPNPIVELDFAGNVHYLNGAAKKLFPDLQDMGVRHPWVEDWGSVVAIFTGEWKISYARDIQIGNLWYEQAMHRVPGTGRIRIYGLDITERKRAEEALVDRTVRLGRMNRELVALNDQLDDFTNVASHDLQEPLRTLATFSDLLRKDLGDSLPERAAGDLGFITDAAKRMQTLIRDLLALSRVARVATKREKVSLSECADVALEALAMRVKEARAKISRDELPSVWGDSTLLTQLYQNLIGNALKFIGDQPPDIRLTAEGRDGDQICGVKDNGIGIEPKYAQQIFESFRRLHGRAEYEGSGIGLAICRKIVERHGGKIWVESEPGKGAHFRFTISQRKKER